MIPSGRGADIAIGIARVARFDVRGLSRFGGRAEDFWASLAPLVAFPLVGTLMMVGQDGLTALVRLLATICALLAPAVLSHFLAGLWQREAEWLRYATAFNWCQWAIPVAAMLLLVVLGTMLNAGLSNNAAGVLLLAGVVGYGLALHWFLAHRGLRLPWLRATLFVGFVNLGTAGLILLPRLVLLAAGEA